MKVDQVVLKCFEGQLVPAPAIKAAAGLVGRRSSSGPREEMMMMTMITMLVMISSPAVVSWTGAQRKRGERERERQGGRRIS